jgi:hypothetical protein
MVPLPPRTHNSVKRPRCPAVANSVGRPISANQPLPVKSLDASQPRSNHRSPPVPAKGVRVGDRGDPRARLGTVQAQVNRA